MIFNRRSGFAVLLGASIAVTTGACDSTTPTPDASTGENGEDAGSATPDASIDGGGDAHAVADAAAPADASAPGDAAAAPDATLGLDAAVDAAAPAEAGADGTLDVDAAAITPDDGGADASLDLDAETGAPDDGGGAAPTCDLGSATSLATDASLNLFGQITYFDEGNVLPAGHYRVQYVDGCMMYGPGQDWTVQAYADGTDAFWLVGATTADKIILPPGTAGYSVATGAYAAFDDCVAANLALAPVDFDFAGGQIGVWLQDSPYSDNVAGVDGRNPKWSLTLLASCVNTE